MENLKIEQKLLMIQNELNVPKSHKNEYGGYFYRNAEDILNSVKPLCKKYGCVLTITDDIIIIPDAGYKTTDKDGNTVEVFGRVYVKAIAKLKDSESEIVVNSFARESAVKKGMDSSQITGSASSYARKYALNGLFAIDDTKDADNGN